MRLYGNTVDLINMIDALISYGSLDTDKGTGRMLYEDEGRH